MPTLFFRKIPVTILYARYAFAPELEADGEQVKGCEVKLSKVTEIVTELARPVVEGLSLILWDVEFQREGSGHVLRVIIDSPDGVSTDMCEAVSRALDPLLDEKNPIEHSYNFEVSSAGLERQLKRQSDFDRFLGHLTEISFYKQHDGVKELTGTLVSRDDTHVVISIGEEVKKFELKDVSSVRLRIK